MQVLRARAFNPQTINPHGYVFEHNTGSQRHNVVYTSQERTLDPSPWNKTETQAFLDGEKDPKTKVLFDPNTWSKDGSVSLKGYYFSDTKYCAFFMCYEEGTSQERNTIRVRDMMSGEDLAEDVLTVGIKVATPVAWHLTQNAFYYCRHDEWDTPHVYEHVIGQPQSMDRAVVTPANYGDSTAPLFYEIRASDDTEREWLLIIVHPKTDGKHDEGEAQHRGILAYRFRESLSRDAKDEPGPLGLINSSLREILSLDRRIFFDPVFCFNACNPDADWSNDPSAGCKIPSVPAVFGRSNWSRHPSKDGGGADRYAFVCILDRATKEVDVKDNGNRGVKVLVPEAKTDVLESVHPVGTDRYVFVYRPQTVGLSSAESQRGDTLMIFRRSGWNDVVPHRECSQWETGGTATVSSHSGSRDCIVHVLREARNPEGYHTSKARNPGGRGEFFKLDLVLEDAVKHRILLNQTHR